MGKEKSTLYNIVSGKGPPASNFTYLLHAQGPPFFLAVLWFVTSAVTPLLLELSAHQPEIVSF